MKLVLGASSVWVAVASDDFAAYKVKFGKTYATAADEDAAKACYEENVELIAGHQAMNSLATFGENKFTDQCAEAFLRERTMGDYMQQQNGICTKTPKPDYDKDPDMNKEVDFRNEGYVNPIKDQGKCGSCWAFSAVANMEAAWFKKTGKLVSLSEQEIVSCDTSFFDMGCMGGGPDTAFKFVIGHGGGMVTEAAYPYVSGTTGKKDTCHDASMDKVAFFGSQQYIPEKDERKLLAALQNEGPISITVNANPWQSYKGGIITAGGTGSTDHAVLLVGYSKGNGTPYWVVRNSWGTDWGESGYIRMAHGNNVCDIVTCMPSLVFAASDADVSV
jgi:C1A family cysteine protease